MVRNTVTDRRRHSAVTAQPGTPFKPLANTAQGQTAWPCFSLRREGFFAFGISRMRHCAVFFHLVTRTSQIRSNPSSANRFTYCFSDSSGGTSQSSSLTGIRNTPPNGTSADVSRMSLISDWKYPRLSTARRESKRARSLRPLCHSRFRASRSGRVEGFSCQAME